MRCLTEVELVAELVDLYGTDPSDVGSVDGTEDDFGDMICHAVEALGYDLATLADDDWQHVQAVAANVQTTTMSGWVAAVHAALPAKETP